MKPKNKVFIATSLDGFIADKNGEVDWLHSLPNPDNDDMGWRKFIAQIDAIVMGRNTFETVLGFDMEWPYQVPVFVLSNTLSKVPDGYEGKAEIVNGPLKKVLEHIHNKGYYNLYIDGGKTIQSFLREDLIDEMTLTIIPYLLGGGVPLFGALRERTLFECRETEIFLGKAVQNRYVRNSEQ